MSRPDRNGPHRIKQVETSASLEVLLHTLSKGDVFVKDGTPHMVCELSASVSAGIAAYQELPQQPVWIVNLQNGSLWACAGNRSVWPSYDTELRYKTHRRGD